MPRAVCVQCGARKEGPFEPCGRCGLDPAAHDSDRDLQARSLLLSEHSLSRRELGRAARKIRAGDPVPHDAEQLARLRAQLITRPVPILEARGGFLWRLWVPLGLLGAALALVLLLQACAQG